MGDAAEQVFDLVVIGGGPGGYVGAIRAAQLGLKTAVIEKEKTLGGTCLNVGCIPSKALLESSELFFAAKKNFSTHGIQIENLQLNLPQMLARKGKIVEELTGGIEYLFKKNDIQWLKGTGKLLSPTEVELNASGAKSRIQTKNIMLATGSVPNTLPTVPFDGKRILSSTEALMLPNVPKHLLVIGAGAIGLEMGSVWLRLGAEVTVIEFMDKIAGASDSGISKRFQQILTKQGMKFVLQAKVTSSTTTAKGVTLNYENLKDGSTHSIEGDYALVATGRKPYSEGLGLEELGIAKDARGFVTVDAHYRTQYPNVYAVGDLIPGPMLAHKAEEEGVAVAELIAGRYGHVNYETVPNVIYTHPELASVGATEEELKKKGIAYKSGSFLFAANGRAKALGDTEGQVKILADAETDRILGVHILGPRASELLGEGVIAMEFGGSSEDLARSFHAHPTLNEVIREAALNVDKRARQG